MLFYSINKYENEFNKVETGNTRGQRTGDTVRLYGDRKDT